MGTWIDEHTVGFVAGGWMNGWEVNGLVGVDFWFW